MKTLNWREDGRETCYELGGRRIGHGDHNDADDSSEFFNRMVIEGYRIHVGLHYYNQRDKLHFNIYYLSKILN